MHLRDVVILLGWLAFCVGCILALGVGFGLVAIGVATAGLGLFALEGR